MDGQMDGWMKYEDQSVCSYKCDYNISASLVHCQVFIPHPSSFMQQMLHLPDATTIFIFVYYSSHVGK